jgi:hypothetical protein
MEIINTFAVVENSLYSVLFDSELGALDDNGNNIPDFELHEFNRLFEFWKDADRLTTFFETHEDDLNDPYWDGITVEEAIYKTKKEAKRLRSIILEYAKKGQKDKHYNLSLIFKPLTDGKIEKKLEKDKVRVDGPKSWLRIYAIRIDVNFFMICGGAIKLRKTLNDRDYLLKELEKLEITRNYLLDEDNDLLEIYELY